MTLRKAEHGAPSEGTSFSGFFDANFGPPARTVPKQRPTSRAGGIQVGTAGYAPQEGGARGLDPSGCQPPIRGAVWGHRRDVTMKYGWIWGLGSWTLCLSPADWEGAMD